MTQTVTGATQPQSDDASRITARDLRSVFWRSFTLQGSWNYERQQHMGYAFAMSPALKRIYQDPTELGRALQRHLVLFNTTPHLSTFIFGLSIAMEEENQRNPEFNEESINAIKTSLMGPLAGIGDSIFWGSLKVIAAGMGISGGVADPLCINGNCRIQNIHERSKSRSTETIPDPAGSKLLMADTFL